MIDNHAFDNMNLIGPECEPDCPVPTDVWARRLDPGTREPTNYVNRVRFRTPKEIYLDLKKQLSVRVCPACKHEIPEKVGEYCTPCPECGKETEPLIDEYFSPSNDYCPEYNQPITPFRRIVCFAVTGGSEGHYIHVGCYDDELQYTEWAIGKTFNGMDHAYEIAKRCAVLLGA